MKVSDFEFVIPFVGGPLDGKKLSFRTMEDVPHHIFLAYDDRQISYGHGDDEHFQDVFVFRRQDMNPGSETRN